MLLWCSCIKIKAIAPPTLHINVLFSAWRAFWINQENNCRKSFRPLLLYIFVKEINLYLLLLLIIINSYKSTHYSSVCACVRVCVCVLPKMLFICHPCGCACTLQASTPTSAPLLFTLLQPLPLFSLRATAPVWSVPFHFCRLTHVSICWPHSTALERRVLSAVSINHLCCLEVLGCLCLSAEGVRWAALGCLALPAVSPPLHPPCRSLFTLRPPSKQRLEIRARTLVFY